MSDLLALFVLGICTFYAVWLSMEFTRRSKLHLLWTIPVGFFGCFVALAIFALIIGQTDDALFAVTASAIFLPFPIWRLFKQQNEQVLPTSASRPKETAAPSPLFNIHKNIKSNIEQQKVLVQKDKGDNLPLPEVSEKKKAKTSQPYNSYLDNDDSILDDDDDEESIELPDGLSLGDEIAFTYTNAKGEFSNRRFVIHGFDGLYLKGWDLDKRNSRTFRTDRIDGGVVKTSTGEVFYF